MCRYENEWSANERGNLHPPVRQDNRCRRKGYFPEKVCKYIRYIYVCMYNH